MKFPMYFIATDTCYGIACPINEPESYRKLYKIKKRNLDKPLAIMAEDFKWLAQNTDLTPEQIDFLKAYPSAFTVLTNSLPIHHWINYEDDEISFENREKYEQIAFRVAHTPEQVKLIKKVGSLFLTSANESNEPELYTQDDVIDRFNYEIEKYKIPVIGKAKLNPKNKPSDIFRFIGDTTEVEYLRKN